MFWNEWARPGICQTGRSINSNKRCLSFEPQVIQADYVQSVFIQKLCKRAHPLEKTIWWSRHDDEQTTFDLNSVEIINGQWVFGKLSKQSTFPNLHHWPDDWSMIWSNPMTAFSFQTVKGWVCTFSSDNAWEHPGENYVGFLIHASKLKKKKNCLGNFLGEFFHLSLKIIFCCADVYNSPFFS